MITETNKLIVNIIDQYCYAIKVYINQSSWKLQILTRFNQIVTKINKLSVAK